MQPSGIIIGGDLYKVIKRFSFDNYEFVDIEQLTIGTKFSYPVYSVVRKHNVSSYHNLLPSLTKRRILESKSEEENGFHLNDYTKRIFRHNYARRLYPDIF